MQISLEAQSFLNDLYVEYNTRRKGVATLLIDSARNHALSTNAAKLVLATARDNFLAQALYEKYGFKKNDFIHYDLLL